MGVANHPGIQDQPLVCPGQQLCMLGPTTGRRSRQPSLAASTDMNLPVCGLTPRGVAAI